MAALDIASLTHPLTQQVIASQYPNLADWQPVTPSDFTLTTTAPPSGPTVYTPPTTTTTTSQPQQAPASPAPASQAVGRGYTSLSQVPQVKAEDYSYTQTPSIFGKHSALWGMLTNQNRTYSAPDDYAADRLARLSSVAKLAGLSLPERRALREQVKYDISTNLVDDKGKPIKDDKAKIAAMQSIYKKYEDPLAVQAAQASATGSPSSGSDPWAGGTDPIEMQAAISQFLAPYARNAAASAGDNAALLREMAAKESSPALAQILNRQASGMAAMGDQAAYSLMQSGQYAPAVAAMQHEASLQAKIAALQNQLATQQTGGIDMSQITG